MGARFAGKKEFVNLVILLYYYFSSLSITDNSAWFSNIVIILNKKIKIGTRAIQLTDCMRKRYKYKFILEKEMMHAKMFHHRRGI